MFEDDAQNPLGFFKAIASVSKLKPCEFIGRSIILFKSNIKSCDRSPKTLGIHRVSGPYVFMVIKKDDLPYECIGFLLNLIITPMLSEVVLSELHEGVGVIAKDMVPDSMKVVAKVLRYFGKLSYRKTQRSPRTL